MATTRKDQSGSSGGGSSEELSGTIRIDGSSTVFPFAQAAAELFNEDQPNVKITTGQSGTGGGFEKFCAGETDISDASRAIEDDEEKACEEGGVSVRPGPGRQRRHLGGVQQGPRGRLHDHRAAQGAVGAEVRRSRTSAEIDPKLPDTTLTLYGPGTDSGTFDFFTEEINGEEGATREDYQASEDDNQLVTGVSGDAGGLGYFGFSYYEANQDKLNLIGVDDGDGCVKPSSQTIQDGSYKPLSRPLFMYPSAKALARPEVKAFMDFVIANQADIAKAANIIALTSEQGVAGQEGPDDRRAEGRLVAAGRGR